MCCKMGEKKSIMTGLGAETGMVKEQLSSSCWLVLLIFQHQPQTIAYYSP